MGCVSYLISCKSGTQRPFRNESGNFKNFAGLLTKRNREPKLDLTFNIECATHDANEVEGMRFGNVWITKRAIRMLLAAVNESRRVSRGKGSARRRFGSPLVAVNGSRMAPRNQSPRG